MLFHDQPRVRELAAITQARLMGFNCLDPIAPEWLHITTYIGPFLDEVAPAAISVMIDEAERLLGEVQPLHVSFSRIYYSDTAIVLPVEPQRALDPVLAAVRRATQSAGCDGHADTEPFSPHVSVAYFNSVAPMPVIVAALGLRLPNVTEVTLKSVTLTAQVQVGRSWQWRAVAEVALGSR
jgi:2'-5' RNA ligase